MPEVIERTPKTEKAEKEVTVPWLITELAKKVIKDTKKGLKKPIDLSDEKLQELALSGVGGMLKSYGVGKMLGGALKLRNTYPEMDKKTLLELTRIPQSEWDRIKNIKWNPKLLKQNYAGRYIRSPEPRIELTPGYAGSTVPWHEFTHARQYKRKKGNLSEIDNLRFLHQVRKFLAPQYDAKYFYREVDPIERMANVVSKSVMAKHPSVRGKAFNKIFGQELEHATARFDNYITHKFGADKVRELWLKATPIGAGFNLPSKVLSTIPKFTSTEQALAFGRMAGKESVPLLRKQMVKYEGLTTKLRDQYKQTQNISDLNEAIKHATNRQFYREALEEMGEM